MKFVLLFVGRKHTKHWTRWDCGISWCWWVYWTDYQCYSNQLLSTTQNYTVSRKDYCKYHPALSIQLPHTQHFTAKYVSHMTGSVWTLLEQKCWTNKLHSSSYYYYYCSYYWCGPHYWNYCWFCGWGSCYYHDFNNSNRLLLLLQDHVRV